MSTTTKTRSTKTKMSAVPTVARGRAVPAAFPTRTRTFWDPVARWETGYQDVVCLTTAGRDALLAATPAAAPWEWIEFPDRWVGLAPCRPHPRWTDDATEDLKMFGNRPDEVKGRPPRYA